MCVYELCAHACVWGACVNMCVCVGVDGRMIILDDQARQQMTRHFLIVTSMQHFAHHGLRQACLIVQNNHPTINSSMPNNFHASV